METINWEDIQRIVLSGYPCLPRSAYVLWRFQPGERARNKGWLADLAKRLTPALPGKGDTRIRAAPIRSLPATVSLPT